MVCVEEAEEGRVHSFRWHPGSRTLVPVASASSHGAHPCHLTVHPRGFLLTANYTSGTVTVHPLGRDGTLGAATDVLQLTGSGPDRERQRSAHPHMVTVVDGALAVADLGSDAVWHLDLDDAGRLAQLGRLDLRAGSGTRQVLADARRGEVHVLGELDGRLTVADWPPTAGGVRAEVPASAKPLPAGALTATLTWGVRPGTLLASHRGADTVVEIDVTGPPRVLREMPSAGRTPRHLVAVGTHAYVANQDSGSVAVLDLAAPASTAPLTVATPSPTCVAPLPESDEA